MHKIIHVPHKFCDYTCYVNGLEDALARKGASYTARATDIDQKTCKVDQETVTIQHYNGHYNFGADKLILRVVSLFSTSFVTMQHYNGHYNRRSGVEDTAARFYNTALQYDITIDVKTKKGYTAQHFEVAIQQNARP